jgi:hypothetical protein
MFSSRPSAAPDPIVDLTDPYGGDAMTGVALKCPNCGAPLLPSAESTVLCRYCNHVVTDVPTVPWGSRLLLDRWEGRPEDGGRERAVVNGRPYVVLGRLGRGDACDAFLARKDARLTEMVVIKILRTRKDADLLAREWRHLEQLARSEAQGVDFFSNLLPQRVTHGRLVRDRREPGRASVFRWRPGFDYSLEDARAAFPSGLDPRAAVWMWKRVLEFLGWLHRSGYAHGGILPAHLLIHPRDHGVALVGWSNSAPLVDGERSVALSPGGKDFYPDDLWGGAPPSSASDLTMIARCLIWALGGDPGRAAPPRSTPKALGELLARYADPKAGGRSDDAWAVKEAVSQAAFEAYGPPKYVPFRMPKRPKTPR